MWIMTIKKGVDDDDNEDNNADVASNADNHLVPLTAGSEPLQAQSGSWQLGGQLLEGLQSFQNAIITDSLRSSTSSIVFPIYTF